MRTLRRSSASVVLALVIALVAVSPAAAGHVTRTVYELDLFELPAGSACVFDVEARPDRGFYAETDLSNGLTQYSVRAHGTYVNLKTNATWSTPDTFRELDRIDAVTGIDHVTMNGQNTYNFAPGDHGPYGPVGPEPRMVHINGAVSFDLDLVTRHISRFAWSGAITDVCAALSN